MNAKDAQFKGTLTAIVTPFTSDAVSIDYQSLEALLDFQAKAGVQGVVVCGSTGEASALSDAEYREVVEFVIKKARGRYQVVAGIGTNNMARALELADYLSGLALNGVLCVTPPYSKPPQTGLLEFYRAVRRGLKHPLIAYNVPGRTGVNLQPATVAQLAREGTIVALKDASGSVDQHLETQRLLESPLEILSGEDNLVASLMAAGATGTISASANIVPSGMVAVTSAALVGEFERSYRAQISLLPAVKAAFSESNPIPVKMGLYQMGIIASPTVRLPLMTATSATQDLLRQVLGL